ncbi:bifunctional protein-serine/threonine kinase/phosphatase [Thalassotalea sp. M1531]|uniref:Bifunctional protein-serine/threonine kinase/phosphatase n=1 Tax=Thalassotalea algicola TaxID=2716224 RepID=A0A7Y0Q7Q6_9GAMM|nr:bifunctional protein-serine/threonine kinase/phosphatase [Thalassotalea algicola]NMP32451.1 bifunctional protein-serine/threonine kinase/phosphatase [Thalassotalea algicola]
MSLNENDVNQSKPLPNLVVRFGGYSCAGEKAENQDAFSAFSPDNYELNAKGFVATLADGVSSANKAKEAAQLAVTQFIQDYYSTPETWSTQKSAAKVMTSLNEWMFSKSEAFHSNNQQWLTTLSSLIIKSTTGYIFHVGDSRISQFRNGQYSALTRDHNRKHGGQHLVLTRALGADYRLKVDAHQIALKVGDIYLLSCDGFHDFLSEQDICQALAEIGDKPSNNRLEALSKNLVETALNNGSDDNVSCLLVAVESLPVRQFSELERDLLNKRVLPALDVGMKLDGYEVLKKIHESTRSHLYLVQHKEEETPLVLKVPSLNFSEDVIYLQGFMREAWLGERVNHKNIMKIKRGIENSQYLYHFCEYIPGQTLSEWVFDNPKPSISQIRDIIKQIITALRVFQRLDVVHRDLKPENIMIDEFGKITLIDYGTALIASLEENADSIDEEIPQGSLNYIAPETLISMKADHHSDLFSLGVIAYQLLTGELPFKPMTRNEALSADYENWLYRPIKQYRDDIPLWLDFALKKATEPNPRARYQAYSEFEADICKPNVSAVEEYKSLPILQRDPVLFWQGMSFIFFILFLVALAN